MSYKIFICYRRADKELARGIENRLSEEFGTGSVFLDVEDIHGGQEWKESLSKALAGDPIVVTLITTKWNSRRGGQPKLMDSNDHVRFELETALGRGLIVLPVLYDRATFPKENQIPLPLRPLLKFQTIPFSNDRYKYDLGKLVLALRSLLGEEPKKEPINVTPTAPKPVTPKPLQTPIFTRSMFTLSTDQKKTFEERRKVFAERAKQEEERRVRARLVSPAFYERPAFWISVVVTLALSGGSVYGAEALATSIGWELNLPDVPLSAGILLSSVWSVGWVLLGAGIYSFDPQLGSKVFYTRGILGGWLLVYEDFEPIGYWAAFPISTTLLWIVARGLAMLASYYLHWDYLLIFWIVITAYTLPILIWYCIVAGIEWQL